MTSTETFDKVVDLVFVFVSTVLDLEIPVRRMSEDILQIHKRIIIPSIVFEQGQRARLIHLSVFEHVDVVASKW